MGTQFMAEMTWEAFRDAVNEKTVCLIPMGSIELEGTHLPLGVDTIVADSLAARLADARDVLIGPTVPIGYSEWFKPFPGTLSFAQDTLQRMLLDYCRGLICHGIRRLVFLNGHKGNNTAIEVVCRMLLAEADVRLGMLNIWKLAGDLAVARDMVEEGRFTHAGEIMTSVVMALKPETVISEKMAADAPRSPAGSEFKVKNSLGETGFRESVQTLYQDIREITDTGTMGDPRPASGEKGSMIIDLMLDYIRAYLSEFQKLPLTE